MILYHGTSGKRAKKILETGRLIANDIPLAHENNPYCKTEKGFVYLTNKIYQAIYYGKIHPDNNNGNDMRNIYIFKIKIEESRLLPDPQDIQIQLDLSSIDKEYTVQQSLDICCSVRTKDDLMLGKEIIAYTTFEYSPFSIGDEIKLIRRATRKATNSKQPQPDIEESPLLKWISF